MTLGTRKQLLDDAIKKAESGNRSPIAGFSNNLSRTVGVPSNENGAQMALEVLRQYMELFEHEDLKPLSDALNRITEKVEVLDGSRARKALGKRAVRLDDLQPIISLGRRRIASKSITTAPTADDFNALRQDMRAILSALSEISAQLSKMR